jgi:hypothetical protein
VASELKPYIIHYFDGAMGGPGRARATHTEDVKLCSLICAHMDMDLLVEPDKQGLVCVCASVVCVCSCITHNHCLLHMNHASSPPPDNASPAPPTSITPNRRPCTMPAWVTTATPRW